MIVCSNFFLFLYWNILIACKNSGMKTHTYAEGNWVCWDPEGRESVCFLTSANKENHSIRWVVLPALVRSTQLTAVVTSRDYPGCWCYRRLWKQMSVDKKEHWTLNRTCSDWNANFMLMRFSFQREQQMFSGRSTNSLCFSEWNYLLTSDDRVILGWDNRIGLGESMPL